MDIEAKYLIEAYREELSQSHQRIALLSALVKQLTELRMADQFAQSQAEDQAADEAADQTEGAP